MLKKLLTSIIMYYAYAGFCQVGVNTSTPTSALDVNGTVRVENLIDTAGEVSLTGVAASTTTQLSRTSTGAGLIVRNNTLELAPVTRNIGALDLSPLIAALGVTLTDISALLGLGEDNEASTFIRVYGYNTTINLTGISGGVHGRRITLYFSEESNVRLKEESILALPQNRFNTLATSQITVSGTGFVELVYDATAGGVIKGRWLVLKFRP